MFKFTLTMLVVAKERANVEAFIESPEYKTVCNCSGDIDYSVYKGEYRTPLLILTTKQVDTSTLFKKVRKIIDDPGQIRACLKKFELELIIELEMSGDGENDSIPGISFTPEILSFFEILRPRIVFVLKVKNHDIDGENRCGAYYYIYSNQELAINVLNKISGSQPSIIEKKGDLINHTETSLNCWGIEIMINGTSFSIPSGLLMEKIHNPRELGLYCKDNNLDSHIDLTYYGIYSPIVEFSIFPGFIDFCIDLDVKWVSIDIRV